MAQKDVEYLAGATTKTSVPDLKKILWDLKDLSSNILVWRKKLESKGFADIEISNAFTNLEEEFSGIIKEIEKLPESE